MNNPQVSIIVPVYKVEKYLPGCIESILSQSYSDFELLLIDDGSPDKSGEICDEYAARDVRIRVFHKTNGGVSSARNLGIEEAKGEWIMFVDSDDFIDADTLKVCSGYFLKYDLIRFSMRLVLNKENTRWNDIEIANNDTKEEYFSKVVSRNAILGVCGGIYKKSIFKDNNIKFSTDLISGEDWFVQIQCLIYCNALQILNKPLYIYNRYVETSCTNVFRFDVHYSTLRALYEIKKLLARHSDKTYEHNYKKEIIHAKCMVVYDYLTNKILHKYKIDHDKNLTYKQLANISLTEVLKVNIPFKWKILLSLYSIGLIK